MRIEDATGKIYTDQIDRFPVTSTRGNKYILVAYDSDSNTVNAEPLKIRTGPDLLATYIKVQNLLEQCGLKPKIHYLDNECPNILKQFMHSKDEDCQLVPPHIHCRNTTEKSISTFKDHLISGLACLPPTSLFASTAISSLRPSSLSASSVHQESIHAYQLMSNSMVSLISTPPP